MVIFHGYVSLPEGTSKLLVPPSHLTHPQAAWPIPKPLDPSPSRLTHPQAASPLRRQAPYRQEYEDVPRQNEEVRIQPARKGKRAEKCCFDGGFMGFYGDFTV